jgi:hypothetical protein
MMKQLERVDLGVMGSTIDKDKALRSAIAHRFSVAIADVAVDDLKEARGMGNRVFVTSGFLDVSNIAQFQRGTRWVDEGEIGLASIKKSITVLKRLKTKVAGELLDGKSRFLRSHI